jgi:hypothetical protein
VVLQQPPSNWIAPPQPSDFDRNIPSPPPSPSSRELLRFPPLNPGEEFDRDALQRRIDQSGLAGEFSDANDIATAADFLPGGRFAPGAEKVARQEEFPRRQGEFQQGQSGSGTASRGEKIASAGERYLDLLKSFQSAYDDLKTTGPTPVNVPYPPAACAQKLEGIAVFGAVFKPEGTIAALHPNAMLASTGYSILDDAAKKTLKERPPRFSPSSTYRLYQLEIEFKYDPQICGGAPVTPSPTRTETQSTPQPLPRPAPTEVKPTNQQPSRPSTEVKPNVEKEAKPAVTPPSPGQKPPAGQPPSPSLQPAVKQQPEPQPQPAEVPASPAP